MAADDRTWPRDGETTWPDDRARLDFPINCVTVHDDRVVVHIGREHIGRLVAFLVALEYGLVDVGLRGAGHG